MVMGVEYSSPMKKIAFYTIILASFLFFSKSAHAVIVPDGYELFLDVTAQIDGSDTFEITGNQWRWQHGKFHFPETYKDIVFPTVVNGLSFLSNFSPVPPETAGEKSFGLYSDYHEVVGLLPIQDIFGEDVSVYLEQISGRGPLYITQTPTVNNNFTMRAFFDDEAPSQYDIYRFKLWATGSGPTTAIPEPSTLLLLTIGVLGSAARRKI